MQIIIIERNHLFLIGWFRPTLDSEKKGREVYVYEALRHDALHGLENSLIEEKISLLIAYHSIRSCRRKLRFEGANVPTSI